MTGIAVFKNFLIVSEREGGLSYLRVIDMRTKASHRIATEEPDYALSLAANPEFESTTVRFNYQSMVTPASVYDYDLHTKQRTLLKRTATLADVGNVAAFVASDWARTLTSTDVNISCGAIVD